MILPLDMDIRLGLLCLACVPGGGISHVAVIIADGDTALSLTMNLISVVAMLGTISMCKRFFFFFPSPYLHSVSLQGIILTNSWTSFESLCP